MKAFSDLAYALLYLTFPTPLKTQYNIHPLSSPRIFPHPMGESSRVASPYSALQAPTCVVYSFVGSSGCGCATKPCPDPFTQSDQTPITRFPSLTSLIALLTALLFFDPKYSTSEFAYASAVGTFNTSHPNSAPCSISHLVTFPYVPAPRSAHDFVFSSNGK